MKMDINVKQHPIATMQMATGKSIIIELYPEKAPNTVNSFIHLANSGMFDNFAIQRVVPGFVIDISYTAFNHDECKYLIANESLINGFANDIPIDKGVIFMGGYSEKEMSGGEFVFALAYTERLNGAYPGFGYVIEGWEEIERIERAELRPVKYEALPDIIINEPVTPEIIKSVRVETFGVIYPAPVKLKTAKLPDNWLRA